ncbi:MAG: M14 family zinc carboxypeptidase [Candidatus Cloacimonadales bacterium]
MKKIVLLLIMILALQVLTAEKAVLRLENPSLQSVEHYFQTADVAAYYPGRYLDLVLPLEQAQKLAAASDNSYLTQTAADLKNNLQARDLEGYRSYYETLAELEALAAAYPEICQLHNLGDSRGKEYSDAGNSYYDDYSHEIWALKISDNVELNEDEPAIYWMGAHHAREPISTEVVMYATNHVLENYGNDPEIKENINNTELWVVPIVNPNGHQVVTEQIDVWWRKNIRDNNENGVFDTEYDGGAGADGVDINRNYGFAWGFVGASGNPSSTIYHGPNEFSEPETQAMQNLMQDHHFVAGNSYHSYSELVLFPFGYANNLTAPDYDALQELAIQMAETIPAAEGGHYTPAESWQLYPAMGTTDDYAYGEHGIFAFTIELATEFIPPANEVTGICEDNLQAALILLNRPSHKMISGLITDAETGDPLVAEVFIEGIDDSEIFRQPYSSNQQFGRYYRLLTEGSYDLTFSAYGYESYTSEDVVVSATDITELNVELVPAAANLEMSGNVYLADTLTPVEDCLIEFVNSDLPTLQTDENGFFSLQDLFQHDYEISFYAEGYEARHLILPLSENQTYFELTLAQLDEGNFESGEIGQYWNFDGNQPWYITSEGYESNNSLRSGNISDQQSSAASFSLNVAAESEISFMKKISTEADYDYLRFYMDDQLLAEWAGEIAWSQETFSVPAGLHTFSWQYVKDQAVSSGSDCVWIDNIIFPQTAGVNVEEDQLENIAVTQMQNYPNPFNPTTTISFSIPENSDNTELKIYNVKGQLVKTLLNDQLAAGEHKIVWNGQDENNQSVASGVYFYKLSSDGKNIATNKMMLMK